MGMQVCLFTYLISICLLEFANGLIQRAGSEAVIPCQSESDDFNDAIQVAWHRNSSTIARRDFKSGKQIIADPRVSIDRAHSLHILAVRPEDSGSYHCTVDSIFSSAIKEIVVQDVPSAPGKPDHYAITSRSVSITWRHSLKSQNSEITKYIVQWRLKDEDWSDYRELHVSHQENSCQIGRLQPNSVYRFRIFAVNNVGRSAPSDESSDVKTLQETPRGVVRDVSYFNVSSNSVNISWSPPRLDELYGKLAGYRLVYQAIGRSQRNIQTYIKHPQTSVKLSNLHGNFTEYVINIQVDNGKNYGPPLQIIIHTEEGVPEKPVNLTASQHTDSSFHLSWRPPLVSTGIIQLYKVMYHAFFGGDVQITRSITVPGNQYTCVIPNLEPYKLYAVFVVACTSKGCGVKSEQLKTVTDVKAPSPPLNVNVTTLSARTANVSWDSPKMIYGKVDLYWVELWKVSNDSDNTVLRHHGRAKRSHVKLQRSIQVKPPDEYDDKPHVLYTIVNHLKPKTIYEVKVVGAVESVYHSKRLFKGGYSEGVQFVTSASTVDDNVMSKGVIAGIVCAIIVLLIVIIVYTLWSKCYQAAYYYLDDHKSHRVLQQTSLLSDTYDDPEYMPISTCDWAKHVAQLHADGDDGFSQEYESIQRYSPPGATFDASLEFENKDKNRYVNIVAYDHSRVKLQPIPGKEKCHSDYINANYVDGFHKPKAYIAAQGPLVTTFIDFWQMIWEQNTFVLVMITNLLERGRRKCDMYWPKEGSEVYGHLQVKFLSETVMASYTIRMFTIKNLKVKKKHSSERVIYQYHFTDWPDHGVPDFTLSSLTFVRKSAIINPDSAGPIIIHCSAGVGRTGTYCVLDSMMRQIKQKQTVNVYAYLKHIRQQRNYLVQTEEQYIFLHDALLEYIQSGETEVRSANLSGYLENLQQTDPKTGQSDFDAQYELVVSFKPKEFHMHHATRECNRSKNRSQTRLPVDSRRVAILAKPGEDGSDYINASFFQGFTRLQDYIITQHPLPNTVMDFWQMIWDHNSQTLILISTLTPLEEGKTEEEIEKEDPTGRYDKFWPEKNVVINYGTFTLAVVEEKVRASYVEIDFLLQSTQDDYELMTKLVYYPGWPDVCAGFTQMFEFLNFVQGRQKNFQAGPVTVIDKYGGQEAATLCALCTLCRALEHDDCVDVYQTAKLYHLRRPGIWKEKSSYMYLYKAIESVCTRSSHVIANGHHKTYHPVNTMTITVNSSPLYDTIV